MPGSLHKIIITCTKVYNIKIFHETRSQNPNALSLDPNSEPLQQLHCGFFTEMQDKILEANYFQVLSVQPGHWISEEISIAYTLWRTTLGFGGIWLILHQLNNSIDQAPLCSQKRSNRIINVIRRSRSFSGTKIQEQISLIKESVKENAYRPQSSTWQHEPWEADANRSNPNVLITPQPSLHPKKRIRIIQCTWSNVTSRCRSSPCDKGINKLILFQ